MRWQIPFGNGFYVITRADGVNFETRHAVKLPVTLDLTIVNVVVTISAKIVIRQRIQTIAA